MPRRLPPLNALKAFEAAARHESFTRAAEELCVTQGAVSHQVKALEAELGLKLFNRERQRLVITEAGRAYLVIVRDAFDRIGDGTERLLQRQSGGALTVSTSPNFAAKWLVHRLGRFAEAHPEIDLRVSASLHHVDFAREDIDLAIRHGDGTAAGASRHPPCTEELFPVCSPKLLDGRNRPAHARGSRAIHAAACQRSAGLEAVARLCRRHRRRPLARPRSQSGQHGDRCGGRRPGRSARPHRAGGLGFDRRPAGPAVRVAMPVSYAYWIVCPKATAKLPKIVAFSEWLLAEAAEDIRQLKKLKSKSRGARRAPR